MDNTNEQVPGSNAEASEQRPEIPRNPEDKNGSQPGYANLRRYPVGYRPVQFRDGAGFKAKETKWTKRTLMNEIKDVLMDSDGKAMRRLAVSIVREACKGNAAALGFLAERLAPLEVNGSGGGKVVFEGIKLEVIGSTDGSKTVATLMRGVDPTATGEDEPRDAVLLESQESQESPTTSDTYTDVPRT